MRLLFWRWDKIHFTHLSLIEKYSNGINELLQKASKEYIKKMDEIMRAESPNIEFSNSNDETT